MPLNTLRLNHQASSHPNDRIVFIKPIKRPPAQQSDYDIADTFLRAIAAQCLPIMKKHWLSVSTLEEYEPNQEFMGRNFNNGECIQLVLQSRSGSWLPFSTVQMVMMHELAHNAHMNHGKLFWQTRNLFAEEMKALWQRGYTGDGLWGSGRVVGDLSAAMGNNVLGSEQAGELSLCGGTYRSRRRKRKAKSTGDELTWKEKRDRRIEKKFGKNGVSLGEDENKRMMLEVGKGPVGGKPKVAQSKRGRELRAAAALARFETNKKEVEQLKQDEEVKEEETESEYEEEDDGEEALDLDGRKLQDKDGRGMTRVCDEEDADDVHVKQEMEELGSLDKYAIRPSQIEAKEEGEESKESSRPGSGSPPVSSLALELPGAAPAPDGEPLQNQQNKQHLRSIEHFARPDEPQSTSTTSVVVCAICSLENSTFDATCKACGHVLDPKKDPRHWKCLSAACKYGAYRNSGDSGSCGICGLRRPD